MVATKTVVSEIDIFVSSTGKFNIRILDHMKKFENNAIVRNIGHFDNAMDLASLEDLEGMKVDSIKPQKIASSSPLVTM